MQRRSFQYSLLSRLRRNPEILALRKIAINLLYGELAGEPFDGGRMRGLIEPADPEKLANALDPLRAVRAARAGALKRRRAAHFGNGRTISESGM